MSIDELIKRYTFELRYGVSSRVVRNWNINVYCVIRDNSTGKIITKDKGNAHGRAPYMYFSNVNDAIVYAKELCNGNVKGTVAEEQAK